MGEVVPFKEINRTKLFDAMWRFVDEIDMPKAYYSTFCLELLRLVMDMEASGGDPYYMPYLPDKKRKKRKKRK